MQTEVFGDRRVAWFLARHPQLPRVVSLLLLSGELACACAPWVPPPVCYGLLCLALLFHAGVALSMGLNTFLFAFASGFPAMIFTSRWLYGSR